MSKNRLIYSTSFVRSNNIIRLTIFVLLAIILINININVIGFSIIAGVLTLFLLVIKSYKIEVREDNFFVKRKHILFLINKSYIFKYNEIKNIKIQQGEWTIWRSAIPLIPHYTGHRLKIICKDGTEFIFSPIHIKWSQVKECEELIRKQMRAALSK